MSQPATRAIVNYGNASLRLSEVVSENLGEVKHAIAKIIEDANRAVPSSLTLSAFKEVPRKIT